MKFLKYALAAALAVQPAQAWNKTYEYEVSGFLHSGTATLNVNVTPSNYCATLDLVVSDVNLSSLSSTGTIKDGKFYPKKYSEKRDLDLDFITAFSEYKNDEYTLHFDYGNDSTDLTSIKVNHITGEVTNRENSHANAHVLDYFAAMLYSLQSIQDNDQFPTDYEIVNKKGELVEQEVEIDLEDSEFIIPTGGAFDEIQVTVDENKEPKFIHLRYNFFLGVDIKRVSSRPGKSSC